MTADFTLAGYRALVEALLGRGYKVVGYGDADPAACHLILRHDLDMSIDAALPLARIETALGVKASYFFLLRGETYNLWTAAARDQIRQILDLGHEIGLHLDGSLYSEDPAALDRAAAQECGALEALAGTAIETVSFHRPEKKLLGRDAEIAGRRHTYQPRFFTEMGYCSDSRGEWRHGHPFDHPVLAESRALQLLIHPIWWNRDEAADPVRVLDQFRIERDAVFAAALSANCTPYREARGDAPGPLWRDDE